jgi:tetratricopeptide (TPR) repeat protein
MSVIANRELGDKAAEGDAAAGLGSVLQRTGDLEGALRHHALHLALAEEQNQSAAQARAHGNLGATHEALGALSQAQLCYEKQLSLALQTGDQTQQTAAYSALGKSSFVSKSNRVFLWEKNLKFDYLGHQNFMKNELRFWTSLFFFIEFLSFVFRDVIRFIGDFKFRGFGWQDHDFVVSNRCF